MDQKEPKAKRSVARKIARILFRTVLGIILLFALIAVLIITPPVQNFIRGKATAWLSNKLGTRVDVGRIYIGFPKKIVLEDIYLEDRQKDTLFAGGSLRVDISMLKLLSSKLEINHLHLTEITAKVSRVLPDTVYNFQFIVDAFATADTTAANPNDSSGMDISVGGLELDKIRLLYNDAVTGSDVTLWLEHFDTDIDVFDLDSMRFDVPETNLSGVRARIYQHKPLVEPGDVNSDSASPAAAPSIAFDFNEFNLENIDLEYGNDISAFYTKLDLGQFTIESDDVDLENRKILLDEITLNNTTASVRLGKTPAAAVVAAKAKEVAEKPRTPGEEPEEATKDTLWTIAVRNIRLNRNNIAFNNENAPVLKEGMDYSHIDAKDISFHIDDLQFSPDSISGAITKGEMSEKSGFRLNSFETEFLYSAHRAYLRDLQIETPQTVIRRSIDLRYPSIETVQKNIGQLRLDINLDESRIGVKDILTFAPFLAAQPAFNNRSAVWLLDGHISGLVSDMNIDRFRLQAFSNTDIDLSGNVKGLPDAKNAGGELTIRKFTTSRADIETLLPKGTIPSNITVPNSISLTGTVAGNINAARGNLRLNTDLGSAAFRGSISNPTDKLKASYNATVGTDNLNLGAIMQNDSLFGPVTARLSATGSGFDPQTANASFDGLINSIVLKGYNYRNIRMNGSMAQQKADFKLDISDPNIDIALRASGNMATKFPGIKLTAAINNINTTALHLTADTLVYKGNINADFPDTDPADLAGQLFVTGSQISIGSEQYKIDTLALTASKSDTGKILNMRMDGMNMALTGRYNLVQLGSVFQQAIQPYYAISDTPNKDTIEDYDFNFRADIRNNPSYKAFIPTLERLEPVTINARFTSGKGFNASVNAPLVIMGTNRIQKLRINAGTANDAININTSLEQFASGESLIIYTTNLDTKIADNKIGFLLNFKDLDNKNKYRLGGLFEQPKPGSYTLTLQPDQLLLNYDTWNLADNNIIRLNNGDINIDNFVLSRQGQQLSINSASEAANSPMEIRFGNFRIGTLTAFAKQDTALADGTINGNVIVNNIAVQPTFVSDLMITNLMLMNDTVGNLSVKVDNKTAEIFNADIRLTGRGNDIGIAGNYHVKPANQSIMNITANIRRLEMKSVEALSMGAISNGTGFLSGKIGLKGTASEPDIDGNIDFNQTSFSPSMLGSQFFIDRESIAVNNQGIHFSSFTVLDSAKNKLSLDGWAYTDNFTNYRFDLNLTADNFQAVNSTKQNNRLFYGRFNFDTDLHIGGTEAGPKVDGAILVNDMTNFTIVMPQADPGIVEREGIVRFIDADSVSTDTTLYLTAADSLKKSGITGMDIAVNIETSKDAVFTLVIDEGNGDFITIQGTAQLTGGIDPSGKTTLAGSYEIEKGAYELSINFLKRKFEIQRGSRITWLGEPTRADLDLTAIYVANTAPITLVQGQAELTNQNQYKQKLPFNVNLNLKGELMKPDISFDVRLPDEDSAQLNVNEEVVQTVEARLAQLRTQPSEMNKQVFALLLLNRFVAENPFESGSGGLNAGTMARQSVSRLLTEQLNALASDLVAGVDINFDVASTEDYTTGERRNRTDLNVSLSKELLNDRLRVTVGNNFELEGPQASGQRGTNLAGNVAVDYLLSKDGRYMIRGYRKNEYEGRLEGYIIETGLNFILTFDYDHFRELFHSRQEKNGLRKKTTKN